MREQPGTGAIHHLAWQSFQRLCAALPENVTPRIVEAWIDARFGHTDFHRMSPAQCRQIIDLCQRRIIQLEKDMQRYAIR